MLLNRKSEVKNMILKVAWKFMAGLCAWAPCGHPRDPMCAASLGPRNPAGDLAWRRGPGTRGTTAGDSHLTAPGKAEGPGLLVITLHRKINTPCFTADERCFIHGRPAALDMHVSDFPTESSQQDTESNGERRERDARWKPASAPPPTLTWEGRTGMEWEREQPVPGRFPETGAPVTA